MNEMVSLNLNIPRSGGRRIEIRTPPALIKALDTCSTFLSKNSREARIAALFLSVSAATFLIYTARKKYIESEKKSLPKGLSDFTRRRLEKLEKEEARVLAEEEARVLAEEVERIIAEEEARVLAEEEDRVIAEEVDRIIAEELELERMVEKTRAAEEKRVAREKKKAAKLEASKTPFFLLGRVCAGSPISAFSVIMLISAISLSVFNKSSSYLPPGNEAGMAGSTNKLLDSNNDLLYSPRVYDGSLLLGTCPLNSSSMGGFPESNLNPLDLRRASPERNLRRLDSLGNSSGKADASKAKAPLRNSRDTEAVGNDFNLSRQREPKALPKASKREMKESNKEVSSKTLKVVNSLFKVGLGIFS
jgi:hypothetical protein